MYWLLVFLSACSLKLNIAGKNFIASESLCIDGAMVNIDAAGCESLYFGVIPRDNTVKIRCTYSPKENYWTQSSFYATPKDAQTLNFWTLICIDPLVNLYAVSPPIRLKNE